MRHKKSLCVTALVVLFASVGWKAYTTSYYDNSRYWGIPLRVIRDAAGALQAEQQDENTKLRIAQLGPEIEMDHAKVLKLAQQQEFLYNELFNATVDLEKNAKIDMNLINLWGPMNNLHLRDFTRTPEANSAVAVYESTLPETSPTRVLLQDLRTALGQSNVYKGKYLDRLGDWHAKEQEKEAKEAEARAKADQARYDAYVNDPNSFNLPFPEPSVQPSTQRSSTYVTEQDGMLLYKTHKLLSDIDMTQTAMAQRVLVIVNKYEQMDAYTKQLEQEDPALKVPGAKLPITYMFIPDRDRDFVKPDMALYTCRVAMFWCDYVGTVKEQTGTRAKGRHPVSSKMVDGILVQIELTNPSAGRATILHIDDPHAI